MADLKYVRIGEMCTIEKGKTGLAKALPGKFPLVATGSERKTSINYQFDTKAVCIPLVSSTGHGKKTLNYVHYQEGKFALGSILAALIPKDENVLIPRYLHAYLQKNKERVLVPLMKGAANVSLSVQAISNIEIPLPTVRKQEEIINKIDCVSVEQKGLSDELNIQMSLLGKLRQAILQDAIDGKITAEWRKRNPNLICGENHASNLLDKIRDKKDHLTKLGELSKNTPLPPITDDKKPFPLPEGWVWCRLGEISLRVHYGFNASGLPEKKDIRLLRITDIQNSRVDWGSVPGCICSDRDVNTYLLFDNDIVIARTGGTIGKSFLVNNIPVKSLFASYLIRIIPSKNINAYYLKRFLESPEYWKQLRNAAWGAGQPNVNGKSLSKLIVPLPSVFEQDAIVERLNDLLMTSDELDKHVLMRKEKSELLMQTVFREAFAVN